MSVPLNFSGLEVLDASEAMVAAEGEAEIDHLENQREDDDLARRSPRLRLSVRQNISNVDHV